MGTARARPALWSLSTKISLSTNLKPFCHQFPVTPHGVKGLHVAWRDWRVSPRMQGWGPQGLCGGAAPGPLAWPGCALRLRPRPPGHAGSCLGRTCYT